MFHSEPMDLILATFIIKMRKAFIKEQQEFYRKKLKVGEIIEGVIPLVDAFRLLSAAFEGERHVGNEVIKSLCPSGQKTEFLLFLISWKMLGMARKTPTDVFAVLDKDGSGALDIEELGAAISKLDFFVSDEELLSLLNYLDAERSGFVDSHKFVQKVGKVAEQLNDTEKWFCSKVTFLCAICDEYEIKKLNDFDKLFVKFEKLEHHEEGKIDREEFKNFVESNDANDNSKVIAKAFEAKEKDSTAGQSMNKQKFAFTIWQHCLCGFGVSSFQTSKVMTGRMEHSRKLSWQEQ